MTEIKILWENHEYEKFPKFPYIQVYIQLLQKFNFSIISRSSKFNFKKFQI